MYSKNWNKSCVLIGMWLLYVTSLLPDDDFVIVVGIFEGNKFPIVSNIFTQEPVDMNVNPLMKLFLPIFSIFGFLFVLYELIFSSTKQLINVKPPELV